MTAAEPRTWQERRRDALRIWQAGVDAVRSDRLVRENVAVDGDNLLIGETSFHLRMFSRILVVGAGKAGAGMAAGLEQALGPRVLEEMQVTGWINVPDDCLQPLQKIHLHGARPAGVNEPRPAGVAGTESILKLVSAAQPDDLCICLLSGGGSSLLPAPIEGVSLNDKLAITRLLSAAGANIEDLNAVRRPLSRIKGGGLARACGARELVTLIISDVLGDPLEVIASGPTVDVAPSPQAALDVLHKYDPELRLTPPAVITALERLARGKSPPRRTAAHITNLVIGNNAVAVDAAGAMAEQLGYSHAMESSPRSEGLAEDIGRRLAKLAIQMRKSAGPDCLISGGEPVVKLVDEAGRGLGGRNQQLALAAAELLNAERVEGITILSAGTDGEDGPTDAAGAIADDEIMHSATELRLDPADFLARNDAYHFFEQVTGLVKTGPTHTNVCDLRVVLVDRRELAGH